MRKNIGCIMLSILLLAVVAGCGLLPWQEFVSREGRFSVRAPGKLEEDKLILNTDLGKVDFHTFLLDTKDDFAYSVFYWDLPFQVFEKKTPEKVLDDTRDGAIINIGAKLLEEKEYSLKGFPGREITVETSNGSSIVIVRILLVKYRIYQVAATTLKTKPSLSNIKKFLDSFRIINPS